MSRVEGDKATLIYWNGRNQLPLQSTSARYGPDVNNPAFRDHVTDPSGIMRIARRFEIGANQLIGVRESSVGLALNARAARFNSSHVFTDEDGERPVRGDDPAQKSSFPSLDQSALRNGRTP